MSLFDSLRDLLPGTTRPKQRVPVAAKPKPALPPPEAITIDHAGVPLVVMFERSAKARRVSLRVDQRNGRVRLVAPPRMARDKALGFAHAQAAWIHSRTLRQSRRSHGTSLDVISPLPRKARSSFIELILRTSRCVATRGPQRA